MKKLKSIIVSLVLLISIVLSFASCGLIYESNKRPAGYTGGFPNEPHFYSNLEIHWVETYEEAMEAIEHLEAYDNRIYKNFISSYENDVVDAKYCFWLYTENTQRRKKGQQWYDHEYSRVSVSYFGFLDKVTIEEIEYSVVYVHKYFRVSPYKQGENDIPTETSYMCDVYETQNGEKWSFCRLLDKKTGRPFADISYSHIKDHLTELPADFHEEFIKSIVPIGGYCGVS